MACVVVFFYGDLQHVGRSWSRSRSAPPIGCVGARRVQMTQMPQLVALFNGVGGGAAALVALLELSAAVGDAVDVPAFTLAATAFTILVGSVSFAGSLVTFAKLQELMTSRPVVFPGLPVAFAVSLLGALVLGVLTVDPAGAVGRGGARRGRPAARRAAGAAGRRCRRTDRDLAAERVHRPDRRGGRLRARQHACCWSPAPWSGASGTFLTKLMASAMGRSVANILFGALQGGSTLGAGVASDRPVRSAGPEDVAILLGYAYRVIIVPGYGLAVAQAQHTLRELVDLLIERGHVRSTTPSTRSPAGCRGT